MGDEGGPLGGGPLRHDAISGSNAERDARLRLLTAQIPAVVWTTDIDLRFTSGVGAGLRALGLHPDQLVGVSLWDYFQTRDPNESQIAAHLAALRGESVGFKATWATRAFEAYVEPLRDEHGTIIGTLGIAHDVTERDYAERERTLLQAKLRHQQRLEAIGTLASGVAHEINNPVQSIMNYAQLIRRRGGTSEIDSYAAEILHEAQRVAAIVRNLRSFARQEGEPYAEVPLADIVTSTLALISVMLRKEGIDIRVDVAADAAPVRCHPQQIQQVLMNVITNARDALNERYASAHEQGDDVDGRSDAARGPGNGAALVTPVSSVSSMSSVAPVARRAIVISSRGVRAGFARLTVEDNGTGIRADMLDKIFDPFCTTKSRRPGAGLGLSISLAIVREHGGNLLVESEYGAFTRVHLDLPVAGLDAPDS